MAAHAVPARSAGATPPIVLIAASGDAADATLARLRRAFGDVAAEPVADRASLVQALERQRPAMVVACHGVPGLSPPEAIAVCRAHDPDVVCLVVAPSGSEPGAGLLEAEAALIESEARFRSLAANLPGMVFQFEAGAGHLIPVYAGEGARRLFGLAPSHLAEQPGAWLARLVPAHAERLRTHLLVATAGITLDGDDAAPTAARNWIEEVVETPADAAVGLAPRYIELTARARRVSPTRVLWDGIAIDITQQVEASAEQRRAREELRELASHLAKVRENERAAIARELHDDVGSTLTAVKFQLAWLKGKAGGDAALLDKLVQLNSLVDGAITASSRIMHDLRPAILDQGIVAALEWQARSFEQHTGIACRFAASSEDIALAAAQAIVVFRVCQEALNNVAKHAGAKHVDVMLAGDDEDVALEIRDDGTGIAAGDAAKPGRFGLRGMQERALAIGADVTIGARDDGPGTSVRLTLPLDPGSAR